jgi:RsiW-degrading membrane proteinase PrsW (M82 family)
LLLVLTAAAALIPSILLMWYFHSRDVFAEPAGVLWRVFGLGVLSIFPILFVALPVDLVIDGIRSPLIHGFASAFLVAAIPEELAKFLVLWLFAFRSKAFDEPMDGVIYGVTASLGFATFENILYVTDAGLGVAVLRAVTAVPSHACAGALMGYFAGRAHFEPEDRRRFLALAIGIPVLLHGLYDFPLMAVQRATEVLGQPSPATTALIAIVPLIIAIEWLWTVRITRRLRAAQIELLGPKARTSNEARPGLTSGVAMTLGGAILTGGGALLTLALAVTVLFGEVAPDEIGELLAGGAILAVAPTFIGIALFVSGIRRLNENG